MKLLFKLLISITMLIVAANAQTIKVGTNATYPPFEFVNEQNQITGFDMDLMAEIAKKVGFKFEIVNISFDSLIPALKAGKIDIIAAAMSATPERLKASRPQSERSRDVTPATSLVLSTPSPSLSRALRRAARSAGSDTVTFST